MGAFAVGINRMNLRYIGFIPEIKLIVIGKALLADDIGLIAHLLLRLIGALLELEYIHQAELRQFNRVFQQGIQCGD